MTKHIQFAPRGYSNDIVVLNKKDDILGIIEFHPSWRTFVFSSRPNICFSFDCLEQIVEKLKEVNK